MSAGAPAAFWVDGTRSAIVLDGAATGGRLALLEELLPHGAGPPLHAHPQDETYHVLEGELVVWSLPPRPLAAWTPELLAQGRAVPAGAAAFVPGGAAHSYRVVSPVARVLVLSTPAGLEAWTRAFGTPARGAGLPPAGAATAHDFSALRAFAQAHGVTRLGPAPPPLTTSAAGSSR